MKNKQVVMLFAVSFVIAVATLIVSCNGQEVPQEMAQARMDGFIADAIMSVLWQIVLAVLALSAVVLTLGFSGLWIYLKWKTA